jgi:quercetin dioxygenase-like cupin family protein
MKLAFALAALTAMGVVIVAQEPGGVVHIDGAKVAEVIAKGGNLAAGQEYRVLGAHREKGGNIELHVNDADIFYIVEGEGTIIIGGTVVGQKELRPGEMTGSDIKAGQTYRLKKGDVMVIPAGVPHWMKEVPAQLNYFVVKVTKH